jgi:hypothetical protein
MTIQDAKLQLDLLEAQIAQEERRRKEADELRWIAKQTEAARTRLAVLRGEKLDVTA